MDFDLTGKLVTSGLSAILVSCTSSFLSKRITSVAVSGVRSPPVPINIGVQQRSVLAPTFSSSTSNKVYSLDNDASAHCLFSYHRNTDHRRCHQ